MRAGLVAAQRAEDELHRVQAGQVPAVAAERPLEEVEGGIDRVEGALKVAVLVQAHRGQG